MTPTKRSEEVLVNLRNTKLIFWANLEPTSSFIQEIFGPLEKYGKSIEIKKFDPVVEFGKIGESLESGSEVCLGSCVFQTAMLCLLCLLRFGSGKGFSSF